MSSFSNMLDHVHLFLSNPQSLEGHRKKQTQGESLSLSLSLLYARDDTLVVISS